MAADNISDDPRAEEQVQRIEGERVEEIVDVGYHPQLTQQRSQQHQLDPVQHQFPTYDPTLGDSQDDQRYNAKTDARAEEYLNKWRPIKSMKR